MEVIPLLPSQKVRRQNYSKVVAGDALPLDYHQPQLLQREENERSGRPSVAHRISRRGLAAVSKKAVSVVDGFGSENNLLAIH